MMSVGAGEMVPWLGALAILAEDLSTHFQQLTDSQSSSFRGTEGFWPL